MRRLLPAHTARRVTAAASMAPMDSAFTKVPTDGSPMAKERMTPVQNPRVPSDRAARQMVDSTWR